MVVPEMLPGVKEYYTNIVAQCFSPCGHHLIVATSNGDIHVFDLKSVFASSDDEEPSIRKPSLTFNVDKCNYIFSLLTSEKFLLVGSANKIYGYEWKSITSLKTPKVSWCWDLPTKKENIEGYEVNMMTLSKSGNDVYAGCGDNNILKFSLEDGRLSHVLEGHQDYIHDVKCIDEDKLVSASEDGTVKFWDLRSNRSVNQLEPSKLSQLERPSLGKWVGSIFVDQKWLVCGGGVKAGLWNIPTMQLVTSYDTSEYGIHACLLHEERVLIGDRYKISEFSLLGEAICSITCSSATQMSISYQEKPHKTLAIVGNSPYIDICTSFDYKDQPITNWHH